jgi:hypothetical protein
MEMLQGSSETTGVGAATTSGVDPHAAVLITHVARLSARSRQEMRPVVINDS